MNGYHTLRNNQLTEEQLRPDFALLASTLGVMEYLFRFECCYTLPAV